MAAADMTANLLSSITGNVNKLYLLMPKPRPADASRTSPPVIKMGSGGKLLAGAALLQDAAGGLTGGNHTGLSGASANVIASANASGYIPVQVQYNPSSISLESQAGQINREMAGAGSESRFEQVDMPEETVLRMDLIFDEMNSKDAFMWDNLRILTAGDILQKGKQLVNAGKGECYTVQNTVEIFVAAIAKAEYRTVGVVWNKMVFFGELFGTTVQYTMFNPSGNPVRARVSIQIRQSEEGKTPLAASVDKYWNDAYANLFQNTLQGGGQSASASLQNLLNF